MLNNKPMKLASPHAITIAITACIAISSNVGMCNATFDIQYLDAQGTGFYDETPTPPSGNNTGTTLGEQRRIAFEYTTNLISNSLSSSVPIKIDASFLDIEGGNEFSAPLAQAGPEGAYQRNFKDAPLQNTWYTAALANKIAKTDLTPGVSEISAEFNAAVDTDQILGDSKWYYGMDADTLTTSQLRKKFDFVSTAMHEIMHGLGFISLIDPQTGQTNSSNIDVYSSFLFQVGGIPSSYSFMTNSQRASASITPDKTVWKGAEGKRYASNFTRGTLSERILLYTPDPVELGSSLSHLSPSIYPNDIMEPTDTGGLVSYELGASLAFLSDMGWGNYTDLSTTLIESTTPIPSNVSVDYYAVVMNKGQNSAPDTQLIYTIPLNARIESATWEDGSCTLPDVRTSTAGFTAFAKCDLGTLASKTSKTITLKLTHLITGEARHSLRIKADIVESSPDNNTFSKTSQISNEGNQLMAFAGPDQRLNQNSAVALDGNNSSGENPIVGFQWLQLSGTSITLLDNAFLPTNGSTAQVNFTTPKEGGDLTLQLTVSDTNNNTASDLVTIEVNKAPVAIIKTDSTVKPNTPITLNGESSVDEDGAIETYEWSQISGTLTTLSDTSKAVIELSTPSTTGVLVFRLKVTDNEGISSETTAEVQVADTTDPRVIPLIAGATEEGSGSTGKLSILSLLLLWLRRKCKQT